VSVGVAVDVGAGVWVAVGAAAVWVMKAQAAICVAVAFKESWEGPQAARKMLAERMAMPRARVFDVFIGPPPFRGLDLDGLDEVLG
jgi:hypothetical protein